MARLRGSWEVVEKAGTHDDMTTTHTHTDTHTHRHTHTLIGVMIISLDLWKQFVNQSEGWGWV